MEYSALIFDDCMDELDSYENLERACRLFQEDPFCKQIVVSCSTEWMLRLAQKPGAKVMMVQMSKAPYVALLNGLKAIIQENVLVVGLSFPFDPTDIRDVLSHLENYPAIYKNKDLQGFDTRLLMFSLQMAIETNIQIDSYAMAIEKLSHTPLERI